MDEQPRQDEPAQPDELGLGGLAHPADDEGLSLEDLSEAYAQLVDGGADPYQDAPTPQPTSGEQPETDADDGVDAGEISPLSILEAMLFVGNPEGEPLTSKYVASLMRGVSPREIDELVGELNTVYEEAGCPYRIESAAAGYLMKLRDEFAGLRDKFYGRVREARLSQSAVDVLALVAYRQPLTSDEVNQLRGVPSGAVLSQLVRRQLLRIERPEEKPRKPQYYTTDRFLHLFGMSAISELPHSQDIDATL